MERRGRGMEIVRSIKRSSNERAEYVWNDELEFSMARIWVTRL
jgi:hypothetical protein